MLKKRLCHNAQSVSLQKHAGSPVRPRVEALRNQLLIVTGPKKNRTDSIRIGA